MKKYGLIGLVFILVFQITACVQSQHAKVADDDLLFKEEGSLKVPDQLTQAEAQKDIAVLLYAFQNGYGGRKYIPSNVFQKAIAEFSSIQQGTKGSVQTQDICKKIADVLFELPDNHLSARINGKDCSQAHDQLSGEGHVGQNVGRGADKKWSVIYKQINRQAVPVLSMTSMPMGEDKIWEGFLESVQKIKESAPALVVDLRGNGGGSDTQPRKMVQLLYGGDFPEPLEEVVKSQTPATFALAANNIQLKINRLKSKQQNIPQYLIDRLSGHLRDYHDAQAKKLPVEKNEPGDKGVPFDATKGFTRPILILIDRACASACESTLEAFEAHPHAVTIGENTGGFIHFGNMGQLVLPNSKIVVQMATDYWKYRDNRFLEKIGYTPQIRVPEGQDAMDVAIAELQKRLK